MKSKVKIKDDTRQLVNQAWASDGKHVITGQALILACLLHTKGHGRDSDDMLDVLRMMNDKNLD